MTGRQAERSMSEEIRNIRILRKKPSRKGHKTDERLMRKWYRKILAK